MTYVRFAPLSPRLTRLLREAHDDGRPVLIVQHLPPSLIVTHQDGSELTETEEREVRALLAADAAEPF